jgi:glycosyltransferase 2 family protein
VIRTVLLFVVSFTLGAVGLYLVGGDVFDPATYAPARVAPVPIVIVIVAVAGLWSLLAWRLKLLVGHQGTALSGMTALLVHLTYTLGSALTPGGSGGGGVLAASLRRLGVRLGRSIAVAVQIFILDIVFLAWASPLALLYLLWVRGLAVPTSVQWLVWTCVGLAVCAAVLLAGYPGATARLILWVARRGPLRRYRDPARRLARDYYRAGRIFQHLSTKNMVTLQLVQLGGWSCSFLALWAWMNLYLPADLPVVLAVATTASLLSIVMPTPGASGLIEAVVGLGAMSELGDTGVAAPILLWRFTTFYIVFMMGPLAGWWLLRTDGARDRERR